MAKKLKYKVGDVVGHIPVVITDVDPDESDACYILAIDENHVIAEYLDYWMSEKELEEAKDPLRRLSSEKKELEDKLKEVESKIKQLVGNSK